MKGRMAWAKRLSALVLIAGLILEFSDAAKSDNAIVELRQRLEETKTNLVNIDPINQIVSDVSVAVTINILSTNFIDLPLSDFSEVALLFMCESNKDVNSFNPSLVLSADGYRQFSIGGLHGERSMAGGYIMKFHLDPLRATTVRFRGDPKVSEIVSNVSYLKIFMKFIPSNAGIAMGGADMTINGSINKHFQIWSQTTVDGSQSGLGFGVNGSTIIATNR